MARLARLAAVAAAMLTRAAAAAPDTLDTPARPSDLASRQLITAVSRAGAETVVAVGQRGHVLRSTDGGRTWAQATVPLSSDLTAVRFVDERTGYAVGHDGVVLKSVDGGARWVKLLDGRGANRLVADHMAAKVGAAGAAASADDRRLLDEARRNLALGPDKPFLDLWFTSADEGWVVGAYNLLLRTTDGGRTWEPWYDRTDNPKLLNLYAIRPARGGLYLAGEAGLLMKLDAAGQRFRALDGGYTGSYFGLVATDAGVIAFGMRGHAVLSRDDGRSWQLVNTGLLASITAGDVAADGSVVLVDMAGGLAISRDGGASFARWPVAAPAPFTAVASLPGAALLGGPRGLRRLNLSKDQR